MSQFETIKSLPTCTFVRKVGINLPHFLWLWHKVAQYEDKERQKWPMKNRGLSSKKLSLQDKVLLTFYYLRHYHTFEQLGPMFGISESYACKIYHRYLDILVKVLKLPSRKALLDRALEAIIIDVSEQPIERPTRKQRQYYSGKKKRHTIKAQLIVGLKTLQILMVVCGKGRTHDFTLLKRCNLRILQEIEKYADAGYQGLAKLFANSRTPVKKTEKKPLTQEEKAFNRALAKLRSPIEHVNRRCKIFRIAKETYRGKHKHYHKIWTVVAALTNLRYAV
jgi:hypothetical protein